MGKAVKKIFHGISKIFSPVLSLVGVITGQWYLAAIGLGLSFFDSSKSPKIPNIKIADDPIGHLVNTKKAGGYIPVVYGRTRIGGNVFFAHSEGSNNKYLYLAIGLGCARINTNDKLWVENIYFDGVPVGVYKKISQSSSEIKYSVNSQVTKIYIAVIYNFKVKSYNSYSGWFTFTQNATKYFTIAHGNTASDDYVSAEFSNNTLIVKAKSSDVSLSRVSTGKYQINNIDEWILPKDNLFEYVFYDGSTWWKWNSNGEWEADLAYHWVSGDESGWSGEPSPIKKVLIENGFHTPRHVAFLAIKLIYNQNRYQKIPTITCEVVRYNRNGSEKWTVAECIYDFMINKEYGLGIDSDRIDIESFDNAIKYCKDNDFYFNGAILEGRAAEILKNLCEHIRADIIYYEGKFQIKIKDLRDSLIDPLYPDKITEEHIVAETFNVSQSDFSSIPNRIRVKYFDPALDYKINTFELSFPGTEDEDDRYMDINLWGYEKEKAEYFANYYLERSRLTTTFSFAVTHEFIDLKIGDLVKLDYKPFGIEDTLVRITSLGLNPYGTLQITAILEDEKLYDKEMNLNIYNIDLTELPDPYAYLEEVSNLSVKEYFAEQPDGTLEKAVLLTWDYDNVWIEQFEVWIKSPKDIDYRFYGITTVNFISIITPFYGKYYFKVIPVSIFGVKKTVSEIETEINFDINKSILGNRTVISGNNIFTSELDENMSPLPEVFTNPVCFGYIGEIGKVFKFKKYYSPKIFLTKGFNGNFYRLDKTEWKIYKVYSVNTEENELLFSFTPTANQAVANFNLNYNISRACIVGVERDDSTHKIKLFFYKETDGSTTTEIGAPPSAQKDNCLADCFFSNISNSEQKGRGVFLLYDIGLLNREIYIVKFQWSDGSQGIHLIPSSFDIYNLNTIENVLLGIAMFDTSRFIYCMDLLGKLQLKFHKYDFETEDEEDGLIIELDDLAGAVIEDSYIENQSLFILLKHPNGRYIANLTSNEDGNIIYNYHKKVDLLGG